MDPLLPCTSRTQPARERKCPEKFREKVQKVSTSKIPEKKMKLSENNDPHPDIKEGDQIRVHVELPNASVTSKWVKGIISKVTNHCRNLYQSRVLNISCKVESWEPGGNMILYTTKDALNDSDTTSNLLWCDTKVNDVILEYGIWWHKIGKCFYPVLGLCRIGQLPPSRSCREQ